jgi:ribonucleotide monophosphatase NagD (HAD superfamily)
MSITIETYKPTICIDVDGVIADYSKGFQGAKVIGDPLPGAKEFLDKLRAAGWKIIIHTTRPPM